MAPQDPAHPEDPYDVVDRLLGQQQVKHLELAQMVGEYRDLLHDLRGRPFDADAIRLARGLPGARYRVNTTYIQQNWLVLEAELKRLFPRDDGA